MRFPWLQVDADFIGAHASDLGARLGISRREAMGLALDLWTWALARARDDAPPDGMVTGTGAEPERLLAGSVCWTGPAEVLSAALVASGLAVRIDDGYRLTGFDRYKATWEKNRRRPGRKPERNRTGTGEEPARKTQTQTQKEEPASQGEPSGPPSGEDQADEQPVDVSGDVEPLEAEERPPLELVAQDVGPKPRRKSKAEELYDGLQEHRRERCERHVLPFIDERWPAQRKNRDLGPIARLLPGSAERERFVAAWNEFLDDERMGQLNVPWSLGYFLQSLPSWEGRALKAAGGGA